MKLSVNTLEILKNYATFNTGIFFRKGNLLRSLSTGKTVLAEATIDETIPADFCVYELNQLLSILSLSKGSPEWTLRGNDIVIEGLDGRSKITYRCCNETNIKTPPEKNIELLTSDATFLLTEVDYNWIMRSASVLGSPNITVEGVDGFISLRAMDAQDDSAHTDTIQICPHTGDDFHFLFKTANWVMMPGSYTVTISSKNAAHFSNTSRKLQYWVALEKRTK